MQTQRINITLPIDLVQDLRRIIPEKSRSKLIAKLLQEELRRKKNLKRDLIKSLRANRKYDQQILEDFKYVDAETFEKLP